MSQTSAHLAPVPSASRRAIRSGSSTWSGSTSPASDSVNRLSTS